MDTGNSYLCGYLKIKGLTEVSTHSGKPELESGPHAQQSQSVKGRQFGHRGPDSGTLFLSVVIVW